MNVAIVDDSSMDRKLLYNYIEQYCQNHKVHVQLTAFESGEEFLSSFKCACFNLVFLDIYMGKSNGMHIAEIIKAKDEKCQIIFTTNSREHAVKAFRLHALDYLTKPYTYNNLEDAMERCETVLTRFSHFIELKEGRHYTRILITDIMYTDYYNHYIQVHTKNSVIRSYMSFADFSPMLEPYPQFLWCYRNCMVNMDYIKSMDDKDFILSNNEHIPISRARKNEIRQAYANYVFDYVSRGNC